MIGLVINGTVRHGILYFNQEETIVGMIAFREGEFIFSSIRVDGQIGIEWQ